MATAHVINGLNGWLAVEIFPVGDVTQQPPESEVNVSRPTDDLIARLEYLQMVQENLGHAIVAKALFDAKARILAFHAPWTSEHKPENCIQFLRQAEARILELEADLERERLRGTLDSPNSEPAGLAEFAARGYKRLNREAEAPMVLPLGHEFQAGHPLHKVVQPKEREKVK